MSQLIMDSRAAVKMGMYERKADREEIVQVGCDVWGCVCVN